MLEKENMVMAFEVVYYRIGCLILVRFGFMSKFYYVYGISGPFVGFRSDYQYILTNGFIPSLYKPSGF